jgi:asparagine synthase (glutamine-hydrolysing)
MYEGIRRLAPGGAVHLTLAGARERRYWKPTFVEPRGRGEAELDSNLREALEEAVSRRLAARGSTGILMSGGLDSASVAAIAAKRAPGRVAAYSAVFPEHLAVDESDLIAKLRSALRLPGLNAEVRGGGLLASALESLSAWQLPLASWGDFWGLALLRAAASSGVEVMLGGDGGDELFGPRAFLLADYLRAGKPRQALRVARELPWGGDPSLRPLMRAVGKFGVAGAIPYGLHAPVSRPFLARGLPAWLTRRTAATLLASDDPLAWKRLDGPRWWAHTAHCLTQIEEVGVFEMHRHRAALAGLEARHPLLDLDLVELVLGQPPQATLDRRRDRPALRASMRGLLPDAVRLRRTKTLFDSLIVDSLTRSDGAAVRRLLGDPRAEVGAYVDLQQVQRSLLENESARVRDPFHWMLHVWRLTTAECWLQAQAATDHLSSIHATRRRLTLRDARVPKADRSADVFHGKPAPLAVGQR